MTCQYYSMCPSRGNHKIIVMTVHFPLCFQIIQNFLLICVRTKSLLYAEIQYIRLHIVVYSLLCKKENRHTDAFVQYSGLLAIMYF